MSVQARKVLLTYRLMKQKQYSSTLLEPSPGARKCSLSTMWLWPPTKRRKMPFASKIVSSNVPIQEPTAQPLLNKTRVAIAEPHRKLARPPVPVSGTSGAATRRYRSPRTAQPPDTVSAQQPRTPVLRLGDAVQCPTAALPGRRGTPNPRRVTARALPSFVAYTSEGRPARRGRAGPPFGWRPALARPPRQPPPTTQALHGHSPRQAPYASLACAGECTIQTFGST